MKIINSSDKPYEFTYDGGHYGPYKPGEILDLPEDMAIHALRKSAILEQDLEAVNVGEIIGYQMEPLENVSAEKRREIVSYKCPFSESGLCDSKPFKTMAELKAHLDTHLELVGAEPSKPAPSAARTK